jgi:uncharacterized membrane protein AbrB (regulator of aidB expression)
MFNKYCIFVLFVNRVNILLTGFTYIYIYRIFTGIYGKCFAFLKKVYGGIEKMEQELKEKEANFRIGDLVGIGITLVVVGVVLSFGAKINSSIQDDFTDGSTEDNVVSNSSEGLATLADNLPLIATIVVAAVVVGIIITYMAGRIGGGA